MEDDTIDSYGILILYYDPEVCQQNAIIKLRFQPDQILYKKIEILVLPIIVFFNLFFIRLVFDLPYARLLSVQ